MLLLPGLLYALKSDIHLRPIWKRQMLPLTAPEVYQAAFLRRLGIGLVMSVLMNWLL